MHRSFQSRSQFASFVLELTDIDLPEELVSEGETIVEPLRHFSIEIVGLLLRAIVRSKSNGDIDLQLVPKEVRVENP